MCPTLETPDLRDAVDKLAKIYTLVLQNSRMSACSMLARLSVTERTTRSYVDCSCVLVCTVCCDVTTGTVITVLLSAR